MKTAAIYDFFGNQLKAAAELGLDQSSLSYWGEYPPPLRQIQIERLTAGWLKAEPECWVPALTKRSTSRRARPRSPPPPEKPSKYSEFTTRCQQGSN